MFLPQPAIDCSVETVLFIISAAAGLFLLLAGLLIANFFSAAVNFWFFLGLRVAKVSAAT